MIFGTPVTLAPSATLVIICCSTNIALRQPANPLLPANTIDGAMSPPIDPHTTSSPAKSSPAAPASPSPKPPSGLAPQASTLIIDITTIPLKAPTTIPPPDLTFAGQTITANNAPFYIIGGQVLAPNGAAITLEATRIRPVAGTSNVVLGTNTKGLGGVITGGFLAAQGRCRRAADCGKWESGVWWASRGG
jgi:hypothetical protein